MVRARDLGIGIGRGAPGPLNAITDVAGVIRGPHHASSRAKARWSWARDRCAPASPSSGRTRACPAEEPLFAGFHTLNGNGEVTGLHWIAGVGPADRADRAHQHATASAWCATRWRRSSCEVAAAGHLFWSLPVVGETWDGLLNDINGLHVQPRARARRLRRRAAAGPVAEGSVGGGTGMICYGFKGGIGTASRVLPAEIGGYTVGVLVQANFGWRADYLVNGVPVGRDLNERRHPAAETPRSSRSIRRLAPSCPRGSRLHRRHHRHRRAPAARTSATRLARRVGLGCRAHRQLRRPLERRHLPRLLHGQPRQRGYRSRHHPRAAGSHARVRSGSRGDDMRSRSSPPWSHAVEEAVLNVLVAEHRYDGLGQSLGSRARLTSAF